MSEQTPARPGDTVLIHLKAVVTHLDDHDNVVMAQVDGESDGTYIPRAASVEILERADDPSRDTVGSRREMPRNDQSRDDSAPIGPFAFKWSEDADEPWVWFRWDGPQLLSNGTVADWPLSTPVASTPAAEAEKPAENSHENHCKDLAEAIYASHIYPWKDLLLTARRYAVHAMRDEAAAEREEAAEAAEPRVFQSDGPEPPEDVTVLEWLDFNPEHFACRYVVRVPGGWAWTNDPSSETDRTGLTAWCPVAARSRFLEVI